MLSFRGVEYTDGFIQLTVEFFYLLVILCIGCSLSAGNIAAVERIGQCRAAAASKNAAVHLAAFDGNRH